MTPWTGLGPQSTLAIHKQHRIVFAHDCALSCEIVFVQWYSRITSNSDGVRVFGEMHEVPSAFL